MIEAVVTFDADVEIILAREQVLVVFILGVRIPVVQPFDEFAGPHINHVGLGPVVAVLLVEDLVVDIEEDRCLPVVLARDVLSDEHAEDGT